MYAVLMKYLFWQIYWELSYILANHNNYYPFKALFAIRIFCAFIILIFPKLKLKKSLHLSSCTTHGPNTRLRNSASESGRYQEIFGHFCVHLKYSTMRDCICSTVSVHTTEIRLASEYWHIPKVLFKIWTLEFGDSKYIDSDLSIYELEWSKKQTRTTFKHTIEPRGSKTCNFPIFAASAASTPIELLKAKKILNLKTNILITKWEITTQTELQKRKRTFKFPVFIATYVFLFFRDAIFYLDSSTNYQSVPFSDSLGK